MWIFPEPEEFQGTRLKPKETFVSFVNLNMFALIRSKYLERRIDMIGRRRRIVNSQFQTLIQLILKLEDLKLMLLKEFGFREFSSKLDLHAMLYAPNTGRKGKGSTGWKGWKGGNGWKGRKGKTGRRGRKGRK